VGLNILKQSWDEAASSPYICRSMQNMSESQIALSNHRVRVLISQTSNVKAMGTLAMSYMKSVAVPCARYLKIKQSSISWKDVSKLSIFLMAPFDMMNLSTLM
jgi:hypothetical protein